MLACTLASSAAPSSSQKSKPSYSVMSSLPSSRTSCSRGPGPASDGTPTVLPGSVPSAEIRAAAMSRLTSPELNCRCRPMKIRPSGLVIAGHANGSTVARITSRSAACSAYSPESRGGGHQLPHRDPLDLVGEPFERAGHENVADLLLLLL